MRLLHLTVASFFLLAFLFLTIDLSRTYTYVPDETKPGFAKEQELFRMELTGMDFILGNLPPELARVEGSRMLPHYRNGAIGCALALFLLLLVAATVKKLPVAAGLNLLLIAGYFVAFIFLENFKNPYFLFSDKFHEQASSLTIQSIVTWWPVAPLNFALILLALVNLVYLFRWKFPRKRAVAVA